MNIDGMLDESRRKEFISILENSLWPASKGSLYVTYMVESQHKGYRIPSNPNDTAGYVILFSNHYFSSLIDISWSIFLGWLFTSELIPTFPSNYTIYTRKQDHFTKTALRFTNEPPSRIILVQNTSSWIGVFSK